MFAAVTRKAAVLVPGVEKEMTQLAEVPVQSPVQLYLGALPYDQVTSELKATVAPVLTWLGDALQAIIGGSFASLSFALADAKGNAISVNSINEKTINDCFVMLNIV